MRNLEKYLKNKEIDYSKILKNRCNKENNEYIYKKKIKNDKFEKIINL